MFRPLDPSELQFAVGRYSVQLEHPNDRIALSVHGSELVVSGYIMTHRWSWPLARSLVSMKFSRH